MQAFRLLLWAVKTRPIFLKARLNKTVKCAGLKRINNLRANIHDLGIIQTTYLHRKGLNSWMKIIVLPFPILNNNPPPLMRHIFPFTFLPYFALFEYFILFKIKFSSYHSCLFSFSSHYPFALSPFHIFPLFIFFPKWYRKIPLPQGKVNFLMNKPLLWIWQGCTEDTMYSTHCSTSNIMK
jgi:hypothetical protein